MGMNNHLEGKTRLGWRALVAEASRLRRTRSAAWAFPAFKVKLFLRAVPYREENEWCCQHCDSPIIDAGLCDECQERQDQLFRAAALRHGAKLCGREP